MQATSKRGREYESARAHCAMHRDITLSLYTGTLHYHYTQVQYHIAIHRDISLSPWTLPYCTIASR